MRWGREEGLSGGGGGKGSKGREDQVCGRRLRKEDLEGKKASGKGLGRGRSLYR